MKLVIGDTAYDYQRALQKIGLGHLYDLKVQAGIGKRSVAQALDLIDEGLEAEADETPEQAEDRAAAAIEDERVLRGLSGLVFICKRHAGEAITWDEAQEFGFGDILFVPDEAPAEPADPTPAPAAEAEPGPLDVPAKNDGDASPKKSKTSKSRSTAESS